MNQVWQVLKAKGKQVWTISKNASVYEALQLMAEKRIGSLMVTDNGKVVGIFSERDNARKVALKGNKPESTKVETIMKKDLISVRPDQTVRECMALMTENRVPYLPVFDGDQLIGILSLGDIVKDIIDELEFLVDQLQSYITGFR